MRYQPVTRQDRGHIGPKWNCHLLRSMQIILQATHGIVSGAPQYFRKAFGDTYQEFDETDSGRIILYLIVIGTSNSMERPNLMNIKLECQN